MDEWEKNRLRAEAEMHVRATSLVALSQVVSSVACLDNHSLGEGAMSPAELKDFLRSDPQENGAMVKARRGRVIRGELIAHLPEGEDKAIATLEMIRKLANRDRPPGAPDPDPILDWMILQVRAEYGRRRTTPASTTDL